MTHNDARRCIVVAGKEKHRITVSLDEDAFESISRIANTSHVSIGWVIRYAVDFFLEERVENQQLFLPFDKSRKG